MAEKEYTWTEKDKVIDHTKYVKKIWDTVLPKTYPHILEFETIGVKEVIEDNSFGEYVYDTHTLRYSVKIIMDGTPLRNNGWIPKEPITTKMVDDAYGEDYFIELKSRMMELTAYVGLGHFGYFDFKGDIKTLVK